MVNLDRSISLLEREVEALNRLYANADVAVEIAKLGDLQDEVAKWTKRRNVVAKAREEALKDLTTAYQIREDGVFVGSDEVLDIYISAVALAAVIRADTIKGVA